MCMDLIEHEIRPIDKSDMFIGTTKYQHNITTHGGYYVV